MIEFKQMGLVQSVAKTPEQAFVPSGNVARTDKTLNVKDRFIANDSEVIARLGHRDKRTAFSTLLTGSVYSAAVSDYIIAVTSLSYAPTIGLPRPSLVGDGKTYVIKDEVGGAGTTTITIRSAGEENIDGASSTTLNVNYSSRTLYSDGANWFTI